MTHWTDPDPGDVSPERADRPVTRRYAASDAAIGQRIKAARTRAGLTQRDLGARLGVSHVAAGDIERGKTHITLDKLDRLARVIGVPVSDLAGEAIGSATADTLDAARALVDLCEGVMSLAYTTHHGQQECVCCCYPRPLHDAACPYAQARDSITGASSQASGREAQP